MPRQRRAWKNWTPFAIVLAVLILTWVIFKIPGDQTPRWLKSLEPLSWAASVLSLLLSVVLSRRPNNPAGPREQLDDATHRLAHRVLYQSQAAAQRLQLENPRALDVQYRAAPEELYDSWRNIQRTPDHTKAPGALLAGSFATIHRTYSAIESGRLLILGKPGAGKTVLAHRLILSVLDNRAPSAPVPVLFNLGTWEPPTSDLADWLVEQLLRNHPHLNGADPTREDANLAEALVRRGLILPVLDAFDEIPAGHYHHAIAKINDWTGPVVVTSRPVEFTAATRGIKVLSRAAGVVVEDLTLEETERFLRLSASKERADAWTRVFDWIRSTPTGDPVRQRLDLVLRTPLMVSLARTVYNDHDGAPPGELLDSNRFPTSSTVEDHLLSAYLTVSYRNGRSTAQQRRAGPTWRPEQARRWLGYLSTVRSPDLAWWKLSTPLHHVSKVLIMGLVGTAAGAVIGTLAYSLGNIVEYIIEGSSGSLPRIYLNDDLGHTEARTGLAVGLAVGIFNVFKTKYRNADNEPERLRLGIWPQGGRTRNPRPRLSRFATNVVFGILLGLVVGLVSVLSFSYRNRFGQTYGLDLVLYMFPGLYSEFRYQVLTTIGPFSGMLRFEADLIFGCTLGVLIGIGYALANPVVDFLGDSVDRTRSADPWESLSTDRTTTLVRMFLIALMAGLVVGVPVAESCYEYSPFCQHDWSEAVNRGTNYGALYASYAALIRLLPSAWGTWLVYVRIWLPLTRRLPWRPKTFLQDAYERQVLRHAGAAYQFRHDRLREHLAEKAARPIEPEHRPGLQLDDGVTVPSWPRTR